MKISNWWNKNMNESMLSTFTGWVGDYNADSKKKVRDYVILKKYESILDVGCGLCDTYYAYKNDKYEIKYTGLDSCKYFVDKAREQNIDIFESDMNKIDLLNNSYDIVYGRHILEHLPTFKDALSEFIRISKFETIIVFFIKPMLEEKINYDSALDLYHNIYSKKDIEDFLVNYNFEWIDINEKEILLHIKK